MSALDPGHLFLPSPWPLSKELSGGETEGRELVVLRPWGCQSKSRGDTVSELLAEANFLLTQMPAFSCRFRGFILLLTFFIYTCYHMSRKPISVVKVRLAWW